MTPTNRREFLQLCGGAAAAAFGLHRWRAKHAFLEQVQAGQQSWLRPPGALAEEDFLARCIQCNQCADVCENDCIKLDSTSSASGTPVIRPREKACILCMKCNNTCPTGALRPISTDPEAVLRNVRMGTAKVDKNICNSYNSRVCGVCVQACPFTGQALRAELWERPVVDEDVCVGCGLCEASCIVYPQAIRVAPHRASQAGADA